MNNMTVFVAPLFTLTPFRQYPNSDYGIAFVNTTQEISGRDTLIHMILAIDIGGTKTLVAGFKSLSKTSSPDQKSPSSGHNPPGTRQHNNNYASSFQMDSGSELGNFGQEEKSWTGSKGERTVLNKQRFPTPHDEQDFLKELRSVLSRFDIKNAQAICVAAPGIIGKDGTVLRCSNLPWTNFPLQKLLRSELKCPVYINNDAKLAGLAETHSLPSLPDLSVYVTVSTGIGTGIITNGRIDSALANSEGGHMMLQTPDGLKEWEDFASGRAIRDYFGKMASEIKNPADWEIVVDRLTLGFQTLIPLLQPNVIIIGGSVGSYFDHFGHLLCERLRKCIPPYIDIPPIVQAQHPEEAVIYGCYYHASHQKADTSA
jgi:predicted NBD/HSP70 family sugar kinase